MYIREFQWDDRNEDHVARHGIRTEEAEQSCLQARRVLRRRDDLYGAFGQTEAGRYLMVVFRKRDKGVVRIITARDMNDREKRWTQNL